MLTRMKFGFASPQATVVIQQGAYIPRLRVGTDQSGDQVFYNGG
jgi:hypothetical protein